MTTFARSGDLRGAEFAGADLRGARFTEADLSGAVMRGVNADGMDIDDPFLGNGMSVLRVNGVDVVPFVEAELNRRFPGRFTAVPPSYAEVLDVRVAMVRGFLATITPDVLAVGDARHS